MRILRIVFCLLVYSFNPGGVRTLQGYLAFFSTEPRPILSMTADGWIVTRVGSELRIFYENQGAISQYGALHLNDSYFRVIYGSTSGWGTSIVLLPAFWSNGVYYHGAPVTVTERVLGADLELMVTGAIGSLDATIRVLLHPPAADSITAEVNASVLGSIALDDRPGEAFKTANLSSMYISSTEWDTRAAVANCQSYSIPDSGWIIQPQPPQPALWLGLLGGTSAWKVNAPTVLIFLDQPQQIAGWVTTSTDPNDDNVGLWAASDQVLDEWNYKIIVTGAPTFDCRFLPLVLRAS